MTKEGRWFTCSVFSACLCVLALQAQTRSLPLLQKLRKMRMHLVDLRNEGYQIAFPKEASGYLKYNDRFDYIYSAMAPNGRSLFAVRRVNDMRLPSMVEDTLLRRPVTPSGVGPEEVINSPFVNIFQFSVSSNERYLAVAGRLRDAVEGKRDAIFLFNRSAGTAQFVAPYASLAQDIRSLNVSDGGDLVIYEDRGTVMRFEAPGGRLALVDHHPGRLPVLMPRDHGYIYAEGERLVLNDGKGVRHELIRASKIVGGIRVSPDGHFLAFGMDIFGNLGITQLRICELDSQDCADGPKYEESIAGQGTFWISQ
jgi:hypothetical protein